MSLHDRRGSAQTLLHAFREMDVYRALGARACVILTASPQGPLRIQETDVWQRGFPAQFYEDLCRRLEWNIRESGHSHVTTVSLKDVYVSVFHAGAQKEGEVRIVFFRCGSPFNGNDLAWTRRFIDLYYEAMPPFHSFSPGCGRGEDAPVQEKAGLPPGAVPRISIRAFGRFDVFADGKLVDFPSAKAKELLALCVDHYGGCVLMDEAIDKLWENRPYDERVKCLYRKATACLRRLFKGLGCPEVFFSARGRCHLVCEYVECDYFRYLQGDCALFPEEYLSNYSWAEARTAFLSRQALSAGRSGRRRNAELA